MDINFQIKGIELLSCSLTTPESARQATSYVYNIKVEHKALSDKKLVFIVVTVDIRPDETAPIVGSISASIYYEIVDFEAFVKINNNELVIDPALASTLNSISISTVRGIIYSTFKGTYLHNTLLPVFSPQMLELPK